MTTWKCKKCSYIYDPAVGDPDGGIPPGTPFEQIPDSWRCPECGATKKDFVVISTASARSTQPAAPTSPSDAKAPAAAKAPSAATESVRPASPSGHASVHSLTVGSLKGIRQP
ncbi:MAG: rubredoxin [Myxococcales bacterium]|nr:rubredoxin [Myxococcales bacterium]